MSEKLEPKSVFVGDEMVGLVSFAKCCEVCEHCLSEMPCDDPRSYACARTSKPEPHPEGCCIDWADDDERWKAEDRIMLWWRRNLVHAGTTCPHFKKAEDYIFVARNAHA